MLVVNLRLYQLLPTSVCVVSYTRSIQLLEGLSPWAKSKDTQWVIAIAHYGLCWLDFGNDVES